MTRNLKALGLALIAVFAMSAVAASAAHAVNAQFTYGAGAVTVDGEQINGVHKFTSMSRTVECDIATFDGTVGATASTTLTVHPTYKDCQAKTAVGTFPATVTVNGCDFLFHGIETPGKTEAEGKWEATTDIECGANPIVVDIYTTGTKTSHANLMCTITIGSQINLGTIKGTNKAAVPPSTTDDIEADIAVIGITATHHFEASHNALLCGSGATGAAKYEGTATLRATNALQQFVNLTISADA